MKYLDAMKTVTNFDQSIMLTEKGEPANIKDIIMQYAIQFTSENGDYKAIMRTRKIAEKLFNHKIDKLELEDAEFDLVREMLKKGIGQQKFHHPDIIMAQVYEAMEQAES